MKIAIFIDNIYPSLGGIGKTTERFIDILIKKNHKIVIICGKSAKQEKKKIKNVKIYALKSFYIPFLKKNYVLSIPKKEEIMKILEREKVEKILSVSDSFLGMIAIECARELNIPLVFGQHHQPENLTRPWHIDSFFTRFIAKKIIKYFCDNSSIVITPSEFSKKLLLGYGVKSKIEVISNGVDVDKFNSEKIKEDLFRKKFNIKEPYILCVGRLMKEKNLPILIKAIKFCPIKLVLIGGGNQKENLEKLIIKNKLQDKVLITGKINEELLLSAYKGCLFYVHSSLIELEGMSVLEAMSMGKPVLIADSKKSTSPFFVQGNGMKFEPKSREDLIKKINGMLKDKKRLIKFGIHSRKITTQKYKIQEKVLELENIFKKLKKF